jgi:hypothetical protein
MRHRLRGAPAPLTNRSGSEGYALEYAHRLLSDTLDLPGIRSDGLRMRAGTYAHGDEKEERKRTSPCERCARGT